MNRHIDISDTILMTERLTLRPWRESDLKDLYEYASAREKACNRVYMQRELGRINFLYDSAG